MATVWTLTADLCPAIVTPSALLSIAGGVPNVASVVTAGASGSGSLTTPFNSNAVRIDALGRAGAGAYAIDWDSNPASAVLPGLDLTVSSGLTLAIAAGQAVLDSVVQKLAASTLVLADSMDRVYIWLSQNGTITPVNNSTAKPGITGPEVFLGSCSTNNPSGSITGIDGSGVLYFRGGSLYRRTADVTTPIDSPPRGLLFLNRGPNDSWLWDGDIYSVIAGNGSGLLPTVIESGDVWTIPAGRQAVLATLQVDGHLTVDGRLKVIGA